MDMLTGRPEYFERIVAQVDPSAFDPSMTALVFDEVLVLEEEEPELHAARARLTASATPEIPMKAPDRLYILPPGRSSIRGSWLTPVVS